MTIIIVIEIETISTTEITRSIITTITAITMEDTATTGIGIPEIIRTRTSEIIMITRGTITGSVMDVENHTMDGKEEYDKRIAQLGVRYATIAE